MQKRLCFKIAAMIILNLNYIICAQPKKLFSAESCRFSDGQTRGALHKNIDRAGVLLVVPLHFNSPNFFENYGIVVGFDKNLESWMLGQAGKSEGNDFDTAVTAARELEEETGGYYKMSPHQIRNLPYLSVAAKQMFVYKVDDFKLPSKIKEAVKKVQFNYNLDQSYKEINDIEVVSLKNLFDLAEKIDSGKIKVKNYVIKTTTGKSIKLNKFYAQVFAHPCDHVRLEYAKQLFKDILHA
jgi:hypothetical protein